MDAIPHELLTRTDVFAGLSAEAAARLTKAATRRELGEGEVLFRQGDATTGFYVLAEGRLEVQKETRGGRVKLSEVLSPAAFGEIGVATGRARTATVRAAEGSVCWFIPREDFERGCAAADPAAVQCAINMVKIVAARLDRLENAFHTLACEREAADCAMPSEDLDRFREQLYSEWAF